MPRVLDIDNGVGYAEAPRFGNQPLPRKLLVQSKGHDRSIWLLPLALCTFGRASDRDITLRIHPTTDEQNRKKTFLISSLHFQLQYNGDAIAIIDPGSSNGTRLKSVGLLAHGLVVEPKAVDEIDVAGVLTLSLEIVKRQKQVTIEPAMREAILSSLENGNSLSALLVGLNKPGNVEFVRLRRVNNCPDEEYVLLFGQGLVDASADALIQLPISPSRGSRGLDLGGDDDVGPLASLFWRGTELMMKIDQDAVVLLNGQGLKKGDCVVLHSREVLEMAGVRIEVEQ